jgi:hypothetical protein
MTSGDLRTSSPTVRLIFKLCVIVRLLHDVAAADRGVRTPTSLLVSQQRNGSRIDWLSRSRVLIQGL